MALFRIFKGSSANLPAEMHDGYCYFTTDDGQFYIDYLEDPNDSTSLRRRPISGPGSSVEYIVGTQTTSTNVWTGVTKDPELYTGKTIVYRLPYGNTTGNNATLTLTFTNPTSSATSGAKPVYYTGGTRAVNHYAAGSVILLTYDGSSWRRADYNANTNTFVTQEASTTDSWRKVLLHYTTNSAGGNVPSTVTNQVYAAKGIEVQPSTGTLAATKFKGPLEGNADTATAFSSAADVTLTGDVTGTVSSTKDWSIATTLAASGVTAGSYGPSANATPGYGTTFDIPYITVDEKGRVTSASTKTVTIPTSDNTDTKVTQNAVDSTVNKDYRIILSYDANDTDAVTNTVNKNTNLRYNPSTNKLSTGNLQLTGTLTVTGQTTLNDNLNAQGVTATNLLVNGAANFVQSPTAPTPASGDSSVKLATTEFVHNAVSGLSGAMHFKGTTTSEVVDGSTTNPITINGNSYTAEAGDVVLREITAGNIFEYVWTGSAWEMLGRDTSFKVQQTAVTDPTASGSATAFIDAISQDVNGVITATKKNLPSTALAIDTGTSSITLAHGGKYKLTAAGSSIIFTMPTDNNTTYSFANGTAGNFTVTPSGGSAQTVSIGKPATAGTADSVAWTGITGKPTTYYTLPTAADSTLGGIKTGFSPSGKNYAIKVDSDGNAYVNVPWTDNNTTSFTITANATDGLWDLTGHNGTNAVTYALAPYGSKQTSASFYTGTTNPTLTTRLNYDGYLYATKLYSGGVEVLTSHQSLDNYKTKQTAITDSTGTSETSTATRFVYSVSQNANGEISVKTRPLPTYNNYSLPLAASGTRGGIQIGYTQSEQNYPVQLNNEKAYVSVPWTDTQVTAVGNHYTPVADANEELTSTLSGTAGAYAKDTEYTVLTGVKAQRDAAGHVVGITYTAQKIKDTNNTYTVGNQALKVASNSGDATQVITMNENSSDRTLTISGDGTYLSGTVSGSSNAATVTLTPTDSGVTAGSYGPSADATPGYGTTFDVPQITVDAKGRVTSASTKTVTIPASDDTDQYVAQNETTTSNWRKVLLAYKSSSSPKAAVVNETNIAYVSTGLEYQPSTGTLAVTSLKVLGSANSSAQLKSDSSNNMYVTINNKTPLVLTDTVVRSGTSAAGTINLGTSAVKWNYVYANYFDGDGSALTSLDASNLSSGTIGFARLPSIYWANIAATDVASYSTTPEVAKVKINGNPAAAAASSKNVELVYDSTLEVLNFVFT